MHGCELEVEGHQRNDLNGQFRECSVASFGFWCSLSRVSRTIIFPRPSAVFPPRVLLSVGGVVQDVQGREEVLVG